MAFRLDDSGLPSIGSYHEALQFWQNAKRWRNKPGYFDERKLDGAKRHTTVRIGNNEQICFRLHSMDVVVYYKDGKVGVARYRSQSTDAFANSLLPDGVRATFNANGADLWIRERDAHGSFWDCCRGFEMAHREVILHPGGEHAETCWVLDHSDIELIEDYRLDIHAANAALKKHKFADFKAWANAYVALHNLEDPELKYLPRRAPDIMEMFKGDWTELFTGKDHTSYRWRRGKPQQLNILFDRIRKAIYKTEGCVTVEELQYVTGWSQQQSIAKRASEYAYI